jgi:acyl-coenzyme A thioesterase PaaI-like protein
MLHGGISTLVIDAACFLAVIPTLSHGQFPATTTSSFQIINAGPGTGEHYEVERRLVRRGKTRCIVREKSTL